MTPFVHSAVRVLRAIVQPLRRVRRDPLDTIQPIDPREAALLEQLRRDRDRRAATPPKGPAA